MEKSDKLCHSDYYEKEGEKYLREKLLKHYGLDEKYLGRNKHILPLLLEMYNIGRVDGANKSHDDKRWDNAVFGPA